MQEKQISIGELKKHLLRIVEEVKEQRIRLIITKRKVPVAQISYLYDKQTSYFGFMKDKIKIYDQIQNISFESEWGELND